MNRIAVTILAGSLAAGCLSEPGDPATNNGDLEDGGNNGATNNGASNNGTNGSNNGASNNGATNNGVSNNGASNNGASNNGASNNGASNNGGSNNATNNATNNGTGNNGTNNGTVDCNSCQLGQSECRTDAAGLTGHWVCTPAMDDGRCPRWQLESNCSDSQSCDDQSGCYCPTPCTLTDQPDCDNGGRLCVLIDGCPKEVDPCRNDVCAPPTDPTIDCMNNPDSALCTACEGGRECVQICENIPSCFSCG